jgi:hypothetical protein
VARRRRVDRRSAALAPGGVRLGRPDLQGPHQRTLADAAAVRRAQPRGLDRGERAPGSVRRAGLADRLPAFVGTDRGARGDLDLRAVRRADRDGLRSLAMRPRGHPVPTRPGLGVARADRALVPGERGGGDRPGVDDRRARPAQQGDRQAVRGIPTARLPAGAGAAGKRQADRLAGLARWRVRDARAHRPHRLIAAGAGRPVAVRRRGRRPVPGRHRRRDDRGRWVGGVRCARRRHRPASPAGVPPVLAAGAGCPGDAGLRRGARVAAAGPRARPTGPDARHAVHVQRASSPSACSSCCW